MTLLKDCCASRSCACTDNSRSRPRDCDPVFMALQDVLNVQKDVCKSAQKQQQLVEWCWFGQVVPKVSLCWWSCGELGAGSSSPFCSSIYWNQLSCSSLELHWDVEYFRCFSYCTTKCWKQVVLRFRHLLIIGKTYCYFHIILPILLKTAPLKPLWRS